MCFYFSLYKSEDIQYFQFDSSGNMYVFEPGAGMSGIAKKIEPGEEFSNSWTNHDRSSLNVTSYSGIASTASSEIHCSYDSTQFVRTKNETKR